MNVVFIYYSPLEDKLVTVYRLSQFEAVIDDGKVGLVYRPKDILDELFKNYVLIDRFFE